MSSLLHYYDSLGATLPIVDRTIDYGALVVPTGNAETPIHRWFHYKEAYSHLLLGRVLKDAAWGCQSIRMVDPFLGSGTSLLSALNLGAPAISAGLGIEQNPFVATLARAKILAAKSGDRLLFPLREATGMLLTQYEYWLHSGELLSPSATLNNTHYFAPEHKQSLLALGLAVASVEDRGLRDILEICVASAIEPAGHLRRDGRTLRFSPNKDLVHPLAAFQDAVDQVQQDLRLVGKSESQADVNVIVGDARFSLRDDRETFNMAIFSPPYPNNIDYTEVYKLESWVLRHYLSADDMRAQRLKTLRSHPSIQFADSYTARSDAQAQALDILVSPLLEQIPRDRYRRQRYRLIRGYFFDMLTVFDSLHECMSVGATAVCVVGNSVHGSGEDKFVIAADLLLSKAAQIASFEVEEVRVARTLRRRSTELPHVRESVIVLKKVGGRSGNPQTISL